MGLYCSTDTFLPDHLFPLLLFPSIICLNNLHQATSQFASRLITMLFLHIMLSGDGCTLKNMVPEEASYFGTSASDAWSP